MYNILGVKMEYFNDEVVNASMLKKFGESTLKNKMEIKTLGRFDKKDALVYSKKTSNLLAVIECKNRKQDFLRFKDYILEVDKVKHWLQYYPDLKFIYLNRFEGEEDYYLEVDKLGLEKHILDGTYKKLIGKNGIRFQYGSCNQVRWKADQDREWLLVDRNLFKKVV